MTMPALVRLPDWPERLARYLACRGMVPFAWGLNDCAMFAADCVLELTGVDVAADLRGSYVDHEGADAIQARHGGLRALVAARLPAYLSPLQAHRGDVVCVEVDDPLDDERTRAMLGIVAGNGYYAAPGLRGVLYRPLAEVRDAYAVG